MLGLGVAISAIKKISDAIDRLLFVLQSRSTFFENSNASKSTIKAIDNADVLDKATILLTPTATSDALVHSVKTYTGDELVTNGGFDSSASWGMQSSWSIASGSANYDGISSHYIEQSNVFSANTRYIITFTISNNTDGIISIRDGAASTFVPNTNYSNGTYTFYITSSTNTTLRIYGVSGSGSLSIDNVSVTEADADFDFDRASSATRINSSGLIQDMQSITDVELVTNGTFDTDSDWNTGSGWTIIDGKANATNAGFTRLETPSGSNAILTVGNTYKCTFDVVDEDGGEIYVEKDINDAILTGVNSVGSYSVIFVAADDQLRFQSRSNSSISIDNVSVKDITFSTDVDLARINYDSNGDNGHILLEPTSTNLVTYSEDFENGYSKVNSSVDLNDAVAPDGTTTANKFNSTALTSKVHKSYQNSSALFHTVSIFLKKGTIDIVSLQVSGASPDINASTTVNLTSGTITASSGNGSITPTITNYGNDWYRITASSTSNGNVANPTIFIVNSSTTASGYFYMWGSQFEGLSYATSYIPTLTGSTVTRATETLTGSGNSTLINSTEGVLYAEIAALANSGTVRYLGLNDGSNDNRVVILNDGTANRIRAIVSSGGTKYADLFYNVTDVTDFHKVAVKYKANDFALWIDGVERATDTSGSVPIGLNDLEFDLNSGGAFYAKCKALAVFNEALSDTQLTNLTS